MTKGSMIAMGTDRPETDRPLRIALVAGGTRMVVRDLQPGSHRIG